MSSFHVTGSSLRYRNLLLVIKQTAFEEYSQIKLRGQAPKALRWKRLEKRYNAHKQCVTDLLGILRKHQVNFSCVNRVELDRQHLADIDLLVSVGGDGTALSAAHFLDHGTIALLGINSDPNITKEDRKVKNKSDERRSHGALCMCTAVDMENGLSKVLYGEGNLVPRTRIRCKVKSTFSETLLVPALNDLLIANPSPAAVSRFRMGWLEPIEPKPLFPPKDQQQQQQQEEDLEQQQQQHQQQQQQQQLQSSSPPQRQGQQPEQQQQQQQNNHHQKGKSIYGTITRFGGKAYDVRDSLNVWSSGMWVSTATGSTAAMAAAGGKIMPYTSTDLQYLIREHMIESLSNNSGVGTNHHNNGGSGGADTHDTYELIQDDVNNGIFKDGDKMHLRWNSQRGRIFIDGSHLSHNLELGDEILIDNKAPPLQLFT